MAMPYPGLPAWAPQATGMSQKSHHSGQHPNHLQACTLIYEQQENLSDRVLIFSLENRWPPSKGPTAAFISLFPFHSVLSVLPKSTWCLQAEHSLSSNCSSATSHTFDLGLVLGFDFLRLQGDIISASLVFTRIKETLNQNQYQCPLLSKVTLST